MFSNYIKIAFRNLLKYKGNSIISISGLAIGMTVCFFLCLWVNDELSYDRFHEKADRIYRMQWEAKYGENSWKIPLVPMPLAGLMEGVFPEVLTATQVLKGQFTAKKDQEFIRENRVLYIDKKFLDVFTVEFAAGTAEVLSQNPGTILITEATAERYFGVKNNFGQVIGRTIERNDGRQLPIGGVVKSFPPQSHLEFDFLAPLHHSGLSFLERRKDQWGFATLWTYFLMNEHADPAQLDQKVQAYVNENISGTVFKKTGNYERFPFEPITDIHLQPNLAYIWMFGLIAIFILLLASINYINLATARAMTRAKEVGVRKVLGSKRSQLIQQFFSESALQVIIALILGILLAEICLPYFNEFVGKQLYINLLESAFTGTLLLALTLFTLALTGIIPALVLSAISPARVIKGQIVKTQRKDRLRHGLVIFQFCISCILIVGTLVVRDQLHFLQSKELGFDQEQVLILRQANGLKAQYQPFLQKMRSITMVSSVSTAQYLPGDGFDSVIFGVEQPANYEETSLSYSHVDAGFVEALGIEMGQGRNFNPLLSTDSTAYLINEKAAEKLGWANPVGKKLAYGLETEGEVIGVMKNFNFGSLHQEIEPLILRMAPSAMPNIFIRLKAGNLTEQLQAIQTEWKGMVPEAPFEFAFLDERIQRLYRKEQFMSSTFSLFALIAIFLACLGLFGLASFIALQRTKEIGIRKVLGASVLGIVGLLSKDFLKLVLIALLIASPIAYYFLEQWLQDFAYRINIPFRAFVLTAFAAMAIAFLTVGLQSLRAALINPVRSLRNE
ncbi:MAG: ABC transporter permease [Bacteroidota bacterium]